MNDLYIEKLQACHCKFGRPVSNVPQIPEDKEVDKQIRLMHTALAELCFAMKEDKMVGIAIGLASLLYATFGTVVMYGIPIQSVFGEVHMSNMIRTGEIHERNNVKEVLNSKGWKG